jgi:hypothetical protein
VTSFNEGWTDDPRISMFATPGGTSVSRPHDALISTPSGPETSSELGYFPSAAFQYGNTSPSPNGDLTNTACTRPRTRRRSWSTSRNRWPRIEVHAGSETLSGSRPDQGVAAGASETGMAADHD